MNEKEIENIELESNKPIFTDYDDSKSERINHSKTYELPTIKTRYISTFIDLVLIILTTFAITAILDKYENVPDYIRAVLFILIVILYEPILISIGCTFGQLFTNIRVRNFKNPERKAYVHEAIFRMITKWLLGGLSFILILFSVNKRALHDYLSGTIVIVPKDK